MDRVIDFEIAPLARDEKEFFKAMGLRIAQLRKNSSITQKGLAGMMGVSQQTVAAWEVGRRGVPVASVPTLARALGSTVPTLIGETTSPAKRAPEPKLLHQIERITQLPKPKQRFVMDMLDIVLAQASSR